MYKRECENREQLDTGVDDTDVLDPKDRIIEALRVKLNETIIRCEKADEIVSDMVKEYNIKSVNLQ